MAETVLRVRFVSGEQVDVSFEVPGMSEVDATEHAITTLADDAGVLRTTHGGRLVVLYGRGVAALEVGPRGAVL